MQRRTDKLVRELLRLYAEYGSSEFGQAVAELERGTLLQDVKSASAALQSFPSKEPGHDNYKSDTLQTHGRRLAGRATHRVVARLESSGREVDQLLATFMSEIATRVSLPTLKVLREYLVYLGLPAPGAKIDRQTAARQIVRFLIEQPEDVMREKIDFGRKMVVEQSTLEGWTKIISSNGGDMET